MLFDSIGDKTSLWLFLTFVLLLEASSTSSCELSPRTGFLKNSNSKIANFSSRSHHCCSDVLVGVDAVV